MQVARFMTVSPGRFWIDWAASLSDVTVHYEDIRLPRRATSGSAGYDFFAPADLTLESGCAVTVPTGIRVKMEAGWALLLFPRSGLGFKYRLQLNNTVGVIDSDYFGAANEGHILIRLHNAGDRPLTLRAGEAFAQGIFLPYGLAEGDDVQTARTGGFGSTDTERGNSND